MNDQYVQENPDTTPVFQNILKTAQTLIDNKNITNFKILIYNGDAGK